MHNVIQDLLSIKAHIQLVIRAFLIAKHIAYLEAHYHVQNAIISTT